MTASGKLSPAERRRHIVEKVNQAKTISSSEILEEFKTYDVKSTTLANDLKLLVLQGHIEKKSHGIYAPPSTGVHVLFGPGNYSARLKMEYEEKTAIAKYIVENHIARGTIIGIDSGTTATAIFREIIGKDNLNIEIITNNLHGVCMLSSSLHISCTIVGGRCNSNYAAIVGPLTKEEENTGIDIGILGVSGVFETTDPDVTVKDGLTTNDREQWPFKEWLALKSKSQIVAADHTKIGQRRGSVFISLSKLKKFLIVTDSNIDKMEKQELQQFKESLKHFGNKIVIVDPDGKPTNRLFQWKSGKPDTLEL